MDADAGFDFEDEAGIDGTADGQVAFPVMLAVELGTVFKESRESGRSSDMRALRNEHGNSLTRQSVNFAAMRV